MQPTTNKTIYDQFFLTMPPIWQVLTIPLLTEEASFTWAFFKYLREFKVAYQQRHLERVIFDYTPIIVGSRKSSSKFLNLNVSGTKRDVAPKQKYDNIHATSTFKHAWATPVTGGYTFILL